MNESHVIAALYRCPSCRAWWSSREGDDPEAQLIFRLAEKHKELFPWEDYQGWRAFGAGAVVCPGCGKEIEEPKFCLTQSGGLG